MAVSGVAYLQVIFYPPWTPHAVRLRTDLKNMPTFVEVLESFSVATRQLHVHRRESLRLGVQVVKVHLEKEKSFV
jgi:hypothetical protein